MITGHPGEAEPAIEIRGLSLSFRGAVVLEDIDLTVRAGDFLGIIGPNGGGKTVLLKILLGLIRPDRGTVRVLGQPPGHARGLVGYVPQHPAFDRSFPIRVREVVLMGRLGRQGLLRPHGREDHERAQAALEQVGMAALADRQIGRLSGGQLQRVLIARALAGRASLLLLDEPTSNLDSSIAGQLYDLLGRLAGTLTVVLVAHDIGVLSRHVRSVACLNRRLHHHGGPALSAEALERLYGYPVDLVLHDHGSRVLDPHDAEK